MSSSQQRETRGGPPNQSRSSSHRTERANGTNLRRNTDIVPPKPTRPVSTRSGHPAQYSTRPAQPRQQNTAFQPSTRGPASYPAPSNSPGIFKRAHEENRRDFSNKSRPDDFTFKHAAAGRSRGTPRAPISPPLVRRGPPPAATKNVAPLLLEVTIPEKYLSPSKSGPASSRMRGVANEPQTVLSTVPTASRAHSNSSLSATQLDLPQAERPSKHRHLRTKSFFPTPEVQETIASAVKMYNPEQIGVDATGLYILFPGTPEGKQDQKRCVDSESVESLLTKLRGDKQQSANDQLLGTNESTPTKAVAELRTEIIQPSPASSTISDNIIVAQRPMTAVPSAIPTTSFQSHTSKQALQKGYYDPSGPSKQTFSVPLNDLSDSRPSSRDSAPQRNFRQDRDDASSCVSRSSSRTRVNCHKCSSIGGQLFSCSTCRRRYHRQCLPLDTSPEDVDHSWQCEFCKRKNIPPKPRKKNDLRSSSAISTEHEEPLRNQKDQTHSVLNKEKLDAGIRTEIVNGGPCAPKETTGTNVDAVLSTQKSITNAAAPPPAIPNALSAGPAGKKRELPLTEPAAKGKQASEDNKVATKAGKTTPTTQQVIATKSSRNKASPPLLTSVVNLRQQSEADKLVESSFTKSLTTPEHIRPSISEPSPSKSVPEKSLESLMLYRAIAGESVGQQRSRDVSSHDQARSSTDTMPLGAGQASTERGDTANLPPAAVSKIVGRAEVHEASNATTATQRSAKTAEHNETNGSASNRSQAKLSTPASVLPPTEPNGDSSAGATGLAQELPLTAVSSTANSASTSFLTAPWAQVDVVRASYNICPSSFPDDDKAALRRLHEHTLALAQKDLKLAVASIDRLDPDEKDQLSTMLYAKASKKSATTQSTRGGLDPLLHWFNHNTRDIICWNSWTSVSMVLLYGLFHTYALSPQFLHSLKEISLREFSFEEVWPLLHDEFQKNKADGKECDIAQLVLQQLKDRQVREHAQRLEDQRRRDQQQAKAQPSQIGSGVKAKRSSIAPVDCSVCKRVKVSWNPNPARKPVCTKCKSKPDRASSLLRFSSTAQIAAAGVKVPTKGLEGDATTQNGNTGHGKPTTVASARRSKTPTPADADVQESGRVKCPRRPNTPVPRLGTPAPNLPPAHTGHEDTAMIETVRMSPSHPPKTPSQRPDTPVLPPAAAGTNHEDKLTSPRRSKKPVHRLGTPVPKLPPDAGRGDKMTGPPAHVSNTHGLRPRTPPRHPQSSVQRFRTSVPEPAATGTGINQEETIVVTSPRRPKTPQSRPKTPVPNLNANDDDDYEEIVVSPHHGTKTTVNIPPAADLIHENAVSSPPAGRPKTPTQRLTTPPVLRPRTPTQRSESPGKGTKTPTQPRKTPVRQSVAADTNIEQTVKMPLKHSPSVAGLLDAVSGSNPTARPENSCDAAGVTTYSSTSMASRPKAIEQSVTTRPVPRATRENSPVVDMEPRQAVVDADETAPENQADPVLPADMPSTTSVPQKRKPQSGTDEIYDLGNGRQRPRHTYWKLISMALCAAPDHRARPAEVANWVSDNIPGYETGEWPKHLTACVLLNAQGKLGRPLSSEVAVQSLGKKPLKYYELLPGLDFNVMQWDSALQRPTMGPSPSSPGIISDSISEPWQGGKGSSKGSSKRRRLDKSADPSLQPGAEAEQQQEDEGPTTDQPTAMDEPLPGQQILKNLANKMKQPRIALDDYSMYWRFCADDTHAPTTSSVDSDLDTIRLDNLDEQVYRDIIPRDAREHMRSIYRGGWKLRACTAFAIFGKDGMKRSRFVEGLATLSLHDIALPKALTLLRQGQHQRRVRGEGYRKPRNEIWAPWDVETYALPLICQAQDCQPCETFRRKAGRKPGNSGNDIGAKKSSASSGVTSDSDVDIEDESQPEQRVPTGKSLEEAPLAMAQQGRGISERTTPRAPSFSPVEEDPERCVFDDVLSRGKHLPEPDHIDQEQEEEDLYGLTDNEMDAKDANDAVAMITEHISNSPAAASDRPSPVAEDVIRDSDVSEEDLYGLTDNEMDAEHVEVDAMEIEHVNNSGLAAVSTRTSTIADDDIRTPDPIEEDLVVEQPEEDQTDLVNFIRQEEAQAVWTEKSLFSAWPELHPDNYFDAEAKIAEIAKRPNRKKNFGKLAPGAVEMPFERAAREPVLPENSAIHIDPIRTRQEGEYMVKSCDTIREFFGLPEEDLVMFIEKKEICFKHAGARSRTVYKTGDRLDDLE